MLQRLFSVKLEGYTWLQFWHTASVLLLFCFCLLCISIYFNMVLTGLRVWQRGTLVLYLHVHFLVEVYNYIVYIVLHNLELPAYICEWWYMICTCTGKCCRNSMLIPILEHRHYIVLLHSFINPNLYMYIYLSILNLYMLHIVALCWHENP